MSIQQSVSMVTPIRMTASGIAFTGGAQVRSISVIAPGSAGNLAVYEGIDTNGPVRAPSVAYTAIAAGDVIEFADGFSAFASMYLTVPTSGIVLVHIAPR